MTRSETIPLGSWRMLVCAVILMACCPGFAAQATQDCGASISRSGDPIWDAISANATVGGLFVHRLRACIERRGDRFSAVLVNDQGEVNQTITGTVRAGRVTAQRSVMGSDNIGERLAGSWKVSTIAPYRMHTIVLTNPWLSIVMTRSDYRGKPLPFTPRD